MASCWWKEASSMFTAMNKTLLNAISAKDPNGKSNENEEDQGTTDWNHNSCCFEPDFIAIVARCCLCCSTKVESIFACVQYGTCKN
jgi:hypothetical protein